jgi:hypothetical protein
MTPRELGLLKQDAMALRKIADTVLARLEAYEKASPSRRRKSQKKVDLVADLKARILTGHLKSK